MREISPQGKARTPSVVRAAGATTVGAEVGRAEVVCGGALRELIHRQATPAATRSSRSSTPAASRIFPRPTPPVRGAGEAADGPGAPGAVATGAITVGGATAV